MSPPTASTLTFVFTDIEGSTRLLRELGPDYARVLRAHDRIIASAAHAHDGEVFGSEGDSQNLVFDDAAAAVRAAVQAQRELAGHGWPAGRRVGVRMGIHSGAAQRDASGFVGLVLHETARISAAGHAGQVLVSERARDLVEERLPDGVSFRDLGRHRFKDLDKALSISELLIDGLPSEFPPLRSIGVGEARLPSQLTSFVTRTEVQAVADLTGTARLVTLTGPGGTGKTRISIEVARRISHRFGDGTWFVALDAIREPALVPSEIVTALGLPTGGEVPLERLVEYLSGRSVLLVLDNLEQVIEARDAVARIVAECPGVCVIATSRTPLRIYGEQEFPVPALPLPPSAPDISAERAAAYESVRLLEERARAAKPTFTLSDDNAADAADIVARLDGLPLAIELAAARLRVLPLAALRRRLDDRLGALSDGPLDRPDRQRTLRAAIAWSYDLLDEPDRRLFARFGVFAGSPSVAQAEAVTDPDQDIGRDIFDGLESLTQQSLVRVIDDAEEPRFAMLATIRSFAREMLAASEEADLIHRRHAEVYLAQAEALAPGLVGPQGARSNDRLERDHDDIRAALDRIVAADQAELGLRMIVAVWRFWQVRGHLNEADRRIHAVLAMPSVAGQPAELRSRAESAAGGISYWRSQSAATHQHYMAALTIAREIDDKPLLAQAVYDAGFAPVPDEIDLPRRMALGSRYFEEALALFGELGDKAGVARAAWSMAVVAASQDRIEDARALANESLDAARDAGDRYQTGWSLHLVGVTEIAAGDPDAAVPFIRESLEMWVQAGDISGIVILLLDAALLARTRGDESCSWMLLGAEERLRKESGAEIGEAPVEFPSLTPRRRPASDEERHWFDEGATLSTEAAIELASETALRDRSR